MWLLRDQTQPGSFLSEEERAWERGCQMQSNLSFVENNLWLCKAVKWSFIKNFETKSRAILGSYVYRLFAFPKIIRLKSAKDQFNANNSTYLWFNSILVRSTHSCSIALSRWSRRLGFCRLDEDTISSRAAAAALTGNHAGKLFGGKTVDKRQRGRGAAVVAPLFVVTAVTTDTAGVVLW